MRIVEFKMIPQIAENLKHLLKNKKKRVEFEESLKIELLKGTMVDPESVDLTLSFNKMSNCYELKLEARNA